MPSLARCQNAEVIQRRIAEGFDVAIFNAPSAPADQVFPVLDHYAEVVRQIRALTDDVFGVVIIFV